MIKWVYSCIQKYLLSRNISILLRKIILIIFRSAPAAVARYVTADVNLAPTGAPAVNRLLLAPISPLSILQDGGNEFPHPQSPHRFAVGEPQGSKAANGCRGANTVGVNLEWCDSVAPLALPTHDVTDIELISYLGKSGFCVVLCTLPKRPKFNSFGPPNQSLLVMNPFNGKQIVDAHIREL